MNDKNKEKKPLSLSISGSKLDAKKSSSSANQVRQSFSHGRSKTVTVEVKKKRISVQNQSTKREVKPNATELINSKKTLSVDDFTTFEMLSLVISGLEENPQLPSLNTRADTPLVELATLPVTSPFVKLTRLFRFSCTRSSV